MLDIVRFFEKNVKESRACTDPAAIALAVAAAYNAIKGRLPADYRKRALHLPVKEITEEIEHIYVKTDKNIFKNSLQVGIARTYGLKGVYDAAVLGVFCDPSKDLRLFDDLNVEKSLATANLVREGKVTVVPDYDWDELRIEAQVTTKETTGIACIVKGHSNISHIKIDGKTRYEKPKCKTGESDLTVLHKLGDFIRIIEEDVIDTSAENKVEQALRINHEASLIAGKEFLKLNRKSIGLTIKNLVGETYFGRDCINLAKEKVSLAVEGRMAGLDITVMTCAGSGNMGLVATIPLLAIALFEFTGKHPESNLTWDSVLRVVKESTPEDWKRLIKAAALAHLIANYVSLYSGELSTLCGGGTKSGVGVAAGIAYYLTPKHDRNTVQIVGQAINNMGRSIFGMICDGAKEDCALKASTATGAAMESALLACRGIGLKKSVGITNENVMVTLQHIGKISKAMESADRKIIEFIQEGNN